MKQKILNFAKSYEVALRTHLKQGLSKSLRPALGLGHQAVALGLETLGLARIHERALETLQTSSCKRDSIMRAENFFTRAITPIVETHLAVRHRKAHLSRLKETLGQRTAELAEATGHLRKTVVRRKSSKEGALKEERRPGQSLSESLLGQKRLRKQVHGNLMAQERERALISRILQDEIAQTLVGINVRLLLMKSTPGKVTRGMKSQIFKTQQLVRKSVDSLTEFARQLNIPLQKPGGAGGFGGMLAPIAGSPRATLHGN